MTILDAFFAFRISDNSRVIYVNRFKMKRRNEDKKTKFKQIKLSEVFKNVETTSGICDADTNETR